MKALKKIALAAMVAASLGAVSTTAFAESDPGRIVYSPTTAIEMTAGKVQVAVIQNDEVVIKASVKFVK